MKCESDLAVKRWIEKHEKDLVCCPHQPGLLLISKRSCLKRYRAALSRVFEDISQENPFHFTLKRGLTLCEGCPIGRRLDEESRAPEGERKSRGAVHGL